LNQLSPARVRPASYYLRELRDGRPAFGNPHPRTPKESLMKAVFAGLLGVALVGVAATAQAQDDNAKKIVGVWEVTKAGGDLPAGSTIEFTKDGMLKAVVKAEGMEVKLDGTYKVEKEKLTVKVKLGEQTVEETATIKKLTDEALEIEDKDKKVDVFKKKK
jgi:uncharacterized protein (TIGR03066 family)